MITNIKLTKTTDTKHTIIVIADNKTVEQIWKKYGLSVKEKAFIVDTLKKRKEIITINQYDRELYVVLVKKTAMKYQILEDCRKQGNKLLNNINQSKIKTITIADETGIKEAALSVAEGMALGNYQFLKYKKETKKEASSLETIEILDDNISKEEINNLNTIIEATCFAKNMINEHPAFFTSTQLGKEALRLGKLSGCKVEVFNKSKIKALKMGGLLAVNRGSQDPPTFSIMEWKPKHTVNKKPYVLVGKGLVFDTGGLSLKPTHNGMDEMKCDMSGAAVVMSTVYAIAKAKLPLHVIGLLPSTDNRPGENAYVPGDVITMHNGLTVEVLNTDAEGRMILADALSYAKKYKPELVIDAATLTGSAARAIGPYGIVFMGTAEEKTKKQFINSGNDVYERVVEFPFWSEYAESLKSDIADIKNIGNANAGAISAGKFLEYFIDYPWLHFDIAGVSFLDKAIDYRNKNATGIGIRLFFNFFKKVAENAK